MKNFETIFDGLASDEKKVLETVIRNRGVTRAGAGVMLGLNKNRMTALVDSLFRQGLLEETEPVRRRSAGRGGVGLGVGHDAFYVVSGVFSSEQSLLILADAAGETVNRIELLNEGNGNTPRFIAEIRQKTTGLLNSVSESSVLGIGIGLPGVVNYANGEVFVSQAFQGLERVNVKTIFRENFGLDTLLIDSAHLQAVNEKLFGSAKELDDFVYLSEGLGVGMFVNGQLLRGYQGYSGELGFMKICDSPAIGPDGRNGLLVDRALFRLIGDKIKSVIKRGGRSNSDFLWDENDYMHPATVVGLVTGGNTFVAQLLSEIFGYIGDALVNLAYLLNPEVIFLPEWTRACPRQTLDVVRGKMSAYCQTKWDMRTRIESASAPHSFAPRAAARLVVNRFLEEHSAICKYKSICMEINKTTNYQEV